MDRWQFHYRIADCAIALHGAGAQLEALAASLYAGARCEEVVPQVRFDLETRAGRLLLQRAGDELAAADSLSDIFQLVEWQLTEAFMRGLDAFYQIHAAVVVQRGRALVLSGPPEAGKTSLAIGLATAGAIIYTDEIALFAADDLRVHPFPRDLIVHQGTQKLFPATTTDQPAWKVYPEYRFLPPSVFGGYRDCAPVPCGELIFPVRKPGAVAQWRALGQAEAAGRLLEQSFSLWDWGAAAVELVGRLVETCPARELVFADAREAVALLLASEV